MSIDISMRSAQKTNARPGGPPTRPLGSCVPVGDASPSMPARKDTWGDGGPWAHWQPTGPSGNRTYVENPIGKSGKKHDFFRGSPVCKWILKIYGNVYLVLGEKTMVSWYSLEPKPSDIFGDARSHRFFMGIVGITSYNFLFGSIWNGEWTPGPQFMASYGWWSTFLRQINVWKNLLHDLGTNEQTVAAKDQWVLVYEIRRMIMFQAWGMVVRHSLVWFWCKRMMIAMVSRWDPIGYFLFAKIP